MDGLNGESPNYADELLYCLSVLKHSYIPVPMINYVSMPLIKNKCGDLSYTNNYRPAGLVLSF